MNNADMPAMPLLDNTGSVDGQFMIGLTKREHFAGMIMQGILSGVLSNGVDVEWAQAATDSVRAADALLAELERTGGQS